MFWLPTYYRLLNFANGRFGVAKNQNPMAGMGVRRDKAALYQWVKVPPG
jgi:hypothetical protein